MDIAILTRDPGLYANRRLAECAVQRGLSLRFIDVLPALDAPLCSQKLPDVVIPRFMPRWQQEGDYQLRALETAGATVLNSPDAIALARSMPKAVQRLHTAQLPTPKTRYFAANDSKSLFDKVTFGFPMLIKREFSAQGQGVFLLQNPDEARLLAAQFQAEGFGFVLQEFVAEAQGADIRLFVLDGRVIASMKRIAAPGEFRANMHLGAQAFAYAPTKIEVEMACKATAALGFTMAGVDMIQSKSGPLVLEVNACPGFEALERVTACNMAGEILDLLCGRQN